MEPFRDLSRTLHPPENRVRPQATAAIGCRPNVAGCLRCETASRSTGVTLSSNPPCLPLPRPPLPIHPTGHSADGVGPAISWVPGVPLPLPLPRLYRHAAAREDCRHGRGRPGGWWREGAVRCPWVPDGDHGRAANRRVACRPGRAVATSRPKLSTQPRPELRPQAGPEVRREPTRSPMLPRLCWCAARSIEAMHAPAVKLHHLAAQFYLTLAPTRHSTQLRPYQRSE